MRVDKTLSELWHLRGSDDKEASDTAFMAINTIKKLLEENRKYENALKEIAESKEDSSCNELALKYEVIAEKALDQTI